MSESHHKTTSDIDYILISDAVGSLVQDVYHSANVQFPNAPLHSELYPFIQDKDSLIEALQDAEDYHSGVIATLINQEMHQYAKDFCADKGLFYQNILADILFDMEKRLDKAPSQKPGIRHQLDDHYYQRIEALEFAVLNDDGQHPNRFEEADIVLLGVSRTSKTPLSMYLANLGYKVANLPLLPESTLPDVIYDINPDKIIGLTNDVNVLNKFRRERLRSYGIEDPNIYSDDSIIHEELDYANDIYAKLNCPIINVADRSIEETATLVLMFLQKNNQL